MKPRLLNTARLSFPLATALAALLATSSAIGQTLFWDGNTTTANADGGTGNWDNNNLTNWDTAATGGANSVWLNSLPNSATFGGTAGTVTLTSAITAGGLTFNTTGYTVTGNTLTLAGTSTPLINATTGTTTITSIIAGTNGFQKSGAGTLVLNTASTFSGGVNIAAGNIQMSTATNSASLFGVSGNTITFSGNSRISTVADGTYNFSQNITINNGVTGTLFGSFGESMVGSGVVAGSGTLQVEGGSNGFGVTLNNANNTFTGAITVVANSTTTLSMASLGTSANAITLSNGGNVGVFTYTGSAAVSRGFAMGGTTGGSTINASGSGALTLTSFSVPNNGAKTLTLGGSSGALNTFQGSIVNSASGNTALTKADAGTWVLSGTNTYSGATLFAGQSNGTLIFSGAASASSNSTFQLREGCTIALRDDTAGTVTFGAPMQINLQSQQTSARAISTMNVNRISTGSNSTLAIGKLNFAGITDNRAGGATVNVTGGNGYKLQFSSMDLDWGINGSQNLNPTSASVIITGTVKHTNGRPVTGTSVEGVAVSTAGMAFVLDGTSTGNLISGTIKNATDFDDSSNANALPLNLTKSNSSIWTLSGTNTYTGTTTVSGGQLLLDNAGSLAAGSAVTVSGGSIGGTGTVNGSLTVSSTGGIDLRDGSTGNLTLGSTLNITGAAGANNLRFDMGNGVATSDQLIVAGTTTVTTTGAAVIDLNWLGGTSGRTPGTYTLIGGAGGLDATNFAKFSLATTAAFGQTYTLVHDLVSDGGTGNLQLTVADVTSVTPAAFWAGGGNNWSTTTNWRDTLAGGGAVAGAPDYQTNVTFSTTSPVAGNLTTNVLDVDFDINSLTFTNASGNVTIGGTKTLTLGAAAENGNTLGNGINSQKTTGTNTISAKVGLAASQTWTVASGGTLAVSGAISDFGLARSLTKAGGGTLTLSGTNTYTGGTIINAGTVNITNHAQLGGSGSNITFGGNATLTLTAASTFGTLAVNSGTATFSNFSGITASFVSTTGSGNITFNGGNNSTGVLDLGNASAFTGNLRTNIGGTGNVPTKGIQFTSLSDAGSMQFGGGDGDGQQSTRYRLYGDAGSLTMSTRQVQFFAKPAGGNSFNRAILQNDNTNAANKWLINTNLANTTDRAHSFELGGTNTGNNEFAGAIINSTNGGHALSLIKQNAGTWILSNTANTYTGGTTISAGSLVIGGAGRLGSGSYAGAISNAGALRYSSSADQTFSGVISGAGSLTKDTSTTSTLTLNTSTNSYTGATNVHAGTLTFAGSSSGTLGAITVGGAGTPVLNIQAGSYTQGAGGFFVGGGTGGAGIVNQTGGTVAWNNNGLQLLIGNGGHAGTYNLSGGSLTTLTGTPSRGVMIGVNDGSSATFNLSGTGTLTVAGTSRLMIGRSDATQINTTNLFSQTGGTATISDMTMGGTSGGAGSGNSATLSLTDGTFTAAAFSLLSAANNDVSTITIGGTAVVTLPNLPTARGSSATATMNFDGGTLRNSATGTFITGLTNAFIMDDGARFDTSLNSTTISQNLLTHGSSLGGGLIKIGANTLTLTGTNTYTGDTVINAGTLLLSAGGSIANSANITLASSATLDVSTLTAALTLGSGQSLKSSATGANPTATVTTVSGNDLTLSAGGLSFTAYDGTNGNSATNAPLTVEGASAGELKLNGAPVTVTTTSSLANGTYVLVAKSGSALVTGTPGTLTVNGAGAAGATSLSVVGDQLVLTVGSDALPPTLTSITDNVSGGPVDIGATINYTVTFNEDIDAASVTTADFDNNGTAGITVVSTNETSPGVFTVVVTANSPGSLKLRIPTGAVIEDVAGNDLVVPVEDNTTITVRTIYDTWANATYSPALTAKLPGDDQDGDTFNNLMEFAFGTAPTVSSAGSIVWVDGGAVTTPGQPVAFNFANPGVDYRAVFGRRKDHVAAGLTYTVEFSAGLDVWVPSAATPTVLTGAGGLNPSEIEAVSVPYPLLIDVGGNNFKKPTFFRVTIED